MHDLGRAKLSGQTVHHRIEKHGGDIHLRMSFFDTHDEMSWADQKQSRIVGLF